MRLAKLLTAITTTTITLAACTTLASANHLSSNTQALRATWTSAELISGGTSARCSLTLEGSLHSRTISKVQEALMGFITRASIGPCSVLFVTVLQASLPWHVRYVGFSGILPAIESISTRVLGFSFEIREPGTGTTCLGTSTATSPATATDILNASDSVTSVTLGGEIPCDISGLPVATFRLAGRSATNSAQTITLI